jgi:hypothetical protein
VELYIRAFGLEKRREGKTKYSEVNGSKQSKDLRNYFESILQQAKQEVRNFYELLR